MNSGLLDRTSFRSALPAVAIAALGAAFLGEMVVMHAVPVARDIQLFFIPHKKILWNALQTGDIPLWTPLIRTGYPVLANFQSGVFYPPHWLYAVAPFLLAFNLLIVLHVVLGGVGTYLLGRKLEFERSAATVGAIAFMLGGYFVSLTNLVNHLQAAAWVPLMIFVLLRHVGQWRTATLLQALGVYLLAFLAGAPQTFALGATVALAVAVVWSGRVVSHEDARPWVRPVITMAGLAVAVAGLAAVQIMPTIEMIRNSSRSGGLSLAEAGHYSVTPVRLLHMVVPNSFADPVYRYGRKMQLSGNDPWLYSLYLGVGVFALAWHARWDRGRRRLVRFWWALAVLGVILALGSHLPVFPWLHEYVPGLASVRYPSKFYLLTGLAFSMLAAHGMSALHRRPAMDRTDGLVALAALLVGLGTRVAWGMAPSRIHELVRSISPEAPVLDHFGFAYVQWESELNVILGFAAIAVACIVSYRRGWLSRRIFVPLIVLVAALDLWVAHRSLNPTVDPGFYRQKPAILKQLPVEELRRTHRWHSTPFDDRAGNYFDFRVPALTSKWYWQQSMQVNTASLYGILGHDASDAIHLKAVRMRNWLFHELPTERRVRLLRLGSVSHVYSPVLEPDLDSARMTRTDSIPGAVYALSDPLPRAYLAHGRRYDEPVDALNAALNPSTDYHREVALLADTADRDEDAALDEDDVQGARKEEDEDDGSGKAGSERPTDPGSATILEDRGEVIRISVEPGEESYLVLTDSWYPGWKAFVDGEPTPIRRANYFYRAVRVEPGDEEVVFRYRPASLRIGGYVSAASTVLLLLGLGGWMAWARHLRDPDVARSGVRREHHPQ